MGARRNKLAFFVLVFNGYFDARGRAGTGEWKNRSSSVGLFAGNGMFKSVEALSGFTS